MYTAQMPLPARHISMTFNFLFCISFSPYQGGYEGLLLLPPTV